ncbi:alpha/beta hydrolase [Spirochaetia bacterium]|nr:alpha/beta hydrolase [Spirochaetia bacterium]
MRKVLTVLLIVWLSALAFATGKVEIKADPLYNFVKLDTGITIAYVELGKKNNPPIVLLHGVTDSYISYSQVAPRLADMGFWVIVPELRGHGKSDKPQNGIYTIDIHTEDINALLEQLNIKNAHITGHSLGSFIAQNLAVEHPDKVSSLTLIGTAGVAEGNEVLTGMIEGDDTFPGINHITEFSDEFIVDWTISSNYDKAFIQKTYEHAKNLPVYVWVNAFNGIANKPETLSKITVPVQIIWGTQDDLFPLSNQIDLIERLGSTNILFLKKEAGHNTHWDNHFDEEVAKDIAAFAKTSR